jgi:hypothetical protein
MSRKRGNSKMDANDRHRTSPQDVQPRSNRETTTFYSCPDSVSADGTLYLSMSVYTDGGHGTGFAFIEPDSPDYELFLWAALQPRGPEELFSNHFLDELRTAFGEARSHATSPEQFRSDLLARFPVTPEMTRAEKIRWAIEQRLENALIFVFTVVWLPISAYDSVREWWQRRTKR